MSIKFEVPTGRGLKLVAPYIIGRNGCYDITALEMWQRAPTDYAEGTVEIQGIGKRGKAIKGGFFCIRADDIDALCKAWIKARGGLVIMPDDNEMTALVTVCAGVVDEVMLSTDTAVLERLGERFVGGQNPDKWYYALECVELVAGELGP